MASSVPLGPLVQAFFVEHLLGHKRVSAQTVASYRDTFRLLLNFLQAQGSEPSALHLTDIDSPIILAFLDHLEQQRKNTVRSRNARLAAIRSFFRYVALCEPQGLAIATRVRAIPAKRTDRRVVGFLTRLEMDAIIGAIDRTERLGRRDHALMMMLYNTGARVSEIISLRRTDIELGSTVSVRLHGKGRKERQVPLWARTARVLRAWLAEVGGPIDGFVFSNARGAALTRFGVTYLLDIATTRATISCQSLASKQVSPHVIRHTTAMHLLQAGVAPAVIALWLGHESLETTHIYLEADLEMKERAINKLAPPHVGSTRFKADDVLLTFLAAL